MVEHKPVSTAGGHEQANDRSGRIHVPGNRGTATRSVELRKNAAVDNECTLVLVKNLSSELAAAGRAAVDHARHVVERGIALTWARRRSWRVHLAGVRGAVHAIHDVRVMITTK